MTQINSGMGRYIRIFVLVDLQFWKSLGAFVGLEAALRKQQIAAHSLLQYDGGIDPTKTVIAADRVLPKDAKVLHFLKEFGHGVRFL